MLLNFDLEMLIKYIYYGIKYKLFSCQNDWKKKSLSYKNTAFYIVP